MPIRPFHLAIPVHDLEAARKFYGDELGCPTGRSTEHWIDFDLYGHQLVCHEIAGSGPVLCIAVRKSDRYQYSRAR